MFSNFKKEQISSIIKNDLPAAIVVFLIALPLCLGIALASGAPLISGIITGVIGGLVVSLISGSSLSVTGPAAGLTVIVLTSITELGSFDAFLMAVCIAGLLQLLFGFLKAGNIANFFPSGVIKGMLAAIGIILILKQIPHALGYDADFEGDEEFLQADNENTFTEIINAFAGFHPGAVIISVCCFIILIGWENKALKKIKLLPAPLVVVIAAIFLNEMFQLMGEQFILKGDHLVQVPLIKNMSDLAMNLTFPNFSQWQNPKVYITAVTIAIVASLETLLSVGAIDKLDPAKRRTPGNRELKAQGIGNLLSGLIGGLPMTAVIVRGSANINSGAKSKASAFFHGIFLLSSILLIPTVINLIPLSALACILIITGYKLAKVSMIKEVYAQGREQFIPFVITIVAILFTDLLKGIAIGMVVAAYFILRRNIKNPYYLNTKRNLDGNKVKIVLAEEVSFLNKPSIIDTLESLPNGTKVTIDGGRSKYIDSDVVEFIEEYKTRSILKDIEVNFIGSSVPLERRIDVPVMNGKDDYHELFKNNREWVQEKIKKDGSYFENMADGQSPKFLWIGCSDSRVDPNSITGTEPGDMFIHRNIANLVVHTDMNLMSVLQYSVEVLKVKHVIVCGHYGCGGIKAATDGTYHGLIDKWLRNIKDVYRIYRTDLEAINDVELKQRRLVELNVREQVFNLCKTSIIQKAQNTADKVEVYGWVYDIREGLVHDLKIDVEKDFPDFNIYKINEKHETASI